MIKVSMEYSKDDKEKIYDGNIHLITPYEMYEITLKDKKYYFLNYKDNTFNVDDKIAILTLDNNGNFVNSSLDDYEKLPELISAIKGKIDVRVSDIKMLPNFIKLGQSLKIQNLINEALNTGLIVSDYSVKYPVYIVNDEERYIPTNIIKTIEEKYHLEFGNDYEKKSITINGTRYSLVNKSIITYICQITSKPKLVPKFEMYSARLLSSQENGESKPLSNDNEQNIEKYPVYVDQIKERKYIPIELMEKYLENYHDPNQLNVVNIKGNRYTLATYEDIEEIKTKSSFPKYIPEYIDYEEKITIYLDNEEYCYIPDRIFSSSNIALTEELRYTIIDGEDYVRIPKLVAIRILNKSHFPKYVPEYKEMFDLTKNNSSNEKGENPEKFVVYMIDSNDCYIPEEVYMHSNIYFSKELEYIQIEGKSHVKVPQHYLNQLIAKYPNKYSLEYKKYQKESNLSEDIKILINNLLVQISDLKQENTELKKQITEMTNKISR